MISRLSLRNVGPLPDREYRFGRRINALTGDNGLGKTFCCLRHFFQIMRKSGN